MGTSEIIKEIDKMPISEKLFIVEKTIHSLRLHVPDDLNIAAEMMVDEYKANKELTVFSSLDMEDFYEPR